MRKPNKNILAVVDHTKHRGSSAFLDITESGCVEVKVSVDGSVLWIHSNGKLVLRICQIAGPVQFDNRALLAERARCHKKERAIAPTKKQKVA